jgi:hypothetical protein
VVVDPYQDVPKAWPAYSFPPGVQLQLCFDSSNTATDVVRSAKDWLVKGMDGLGLQVWQGELPDQVSDWHAAAAQVAGQKDAPLRLLIGGSQKVGDESREFSWSDPSDLQRVLGASTFPESEWSVETFRRLVPPKPNPPGPPQTEILLFDVGVNTRPGGKVILSASIPVEWLCAAEGRQQAAIDLLRAVAEESNPNFGQIAEGGQPLWATPLEASLRIMGAPSTRSILRGYSWITIACQEIGDRLGGLTALRDSGAFWEVEQLSGGGYWLRASPNFLDFDLAAAERVHGVVGPVLHPGMPKAPDHRDAPRTIVMRPGGTALGS